MKKIKFYLPFVILFLLLGLLCRVLIYPQPKALNNALVGVSVPHFQLPDLLQKNKTFTEKDLYGQVSLLNIWASWCYACQLEHPMLLQIKNDYHIPIYSIVYKDNPQTAISWLKESDNPYRLIGNDSNGNVSIDFGIYGTPETFIIDRNGTIIHRHIGAITPENWQNELFPLIQQLVTEK